MDKRYQVFVSSTYVDLKEERQNVIQTLMEMDCIPAGMELFPAADEEQWEFIKRVIDDCDYYLLIVGGRYGSTAEDGLSYTEKEFDYAVSKGIKVIALLHKSPESLPREKTENSDELYKKLNAFRDKASEGRLVRFWSTASELSGLVSLSLNKTIKMYPAVGWVRANTASSSELLTEINSLRKANEALKLQLEQSNESSFLLNEEELAGWADSFKIKGTFDNASAFSGNAQTIVWESIRTWQEIFSLISPMISDGALSEDINQFLAKQFSNTLGSQKKYYLRIDDQVFYTIRIQFLALGIIEVKNTGANSSWTLTEKGIQLMIKERAVFR